MLNACLCYGFCINEQDNTCMFIESLAWVMVLMIFITHDIATYMASLPNHALWGGPDCWYTWFYGKEMRSKRQVATREASVHCATVSYKFSRGFNFHGFCGWFSTCENLTLYLVHFQTTPPKTFTMININSEHIPLCVLQHPHVRSWIREHGIVEILSSCGWSVHSSIVYCSTGKNYHPRKLVPAKINK